MSAFSHDALESSLYAVLSSMTAHPAWSGVAVPTHPESCCILRLVRYDYSFPLRYRIKLSNVVE